MAHDRSSAAPATTLGLYAFAHLCVDATCGALLWKAVHDGLVTSATAWSAFVGYNVLAFALQPVVGIAVDRLRAPRAAAAVGGLLTVVAVPVMAMPGAFALAVALVGLGNAVFHVGGGVTSIAVAPGRATPLGLFVAPGAAGVAAGIAVGKSGGPVWPFAAALAILVLLPFVLPGVSSWRVAAGRPGRRSPAPGVVELIVVLVLLAVAVRAYVGLAVAFPWKTRPELLVGLTAAVVAGKALGGVVADRFGWRPVAVGSLLVSAPLLALGTGSPALGVAGALVFNLTMPVTLAAAVAALPGHGGFAFGLTCLALFVGSAPLLFGWGGPVSTVALLVLAAGAALALWVALGRLATAAAGERSSPATVIPEGGLS